MNNESLTGKWEQLIGNIKEKWGRLTDDDLKVVAGRKDQLIGKLRERYGMAKEKAEEEVERLLSGDKPERDSFTQEDSEWRDRIDSRL